MALAESSFIDSINVTPNGHIEVRTATVITRDGVEVSRTYHRTTLAPHADLEGQDERVASIARAAWEFVEAAPT